MVILIEKGKIKSIARRVMSSHILGVWIPDYYYMSREIKSDADSSVLAAQIFYEHGVISTATNGCNDLFAPLLRRI